MRGTDGMQEALFTIAQLEELCLAEHRSLSRVGCLVVRLASMLLHGFTDDHAIAENAMDDIEPAATPARHSAFT